MPTPLRRRLRLAQRGFWYAVAIALVCVAMLVGAVSQLLPLAERHPDRIAAWLSERAGRPVAFDHVETEWTRRGPLLRLDGLRIGEGEGVRIGAAEVLVSMYGGLLPGHAFTELRLRGLSLTLQRGDDGAWSVRGLPGQQTGGDPLESLEGLGELQVVGGRLAIVAPALGWNVQLPKIDLRLRVDGGRVRAGARVLAREGGKPLQAALDFDRERGDGRAYLRGRPLDLADWSPLLAWAGVRLQAGQGSTESWVRLYRHRVVMATTELQLQQVVLGRGAADGGQRVVFDQVGGRLRWRLREGGWRLDAPALRIGMRDAKRDAAKQNATKPAEPLKLDGLLLAGGRDYALRAQQIEAAPLLAVLALSDFVEPDLRRWLISARPDARLSKLSLSGRRGGALRAQGHLDGVAFAAVGDAPGIDGLAGEFSGDADGFALKLDPQARLRFDWPQGFGVGHDVALRGEIAGWREGAGWRFATPALRVQGKDYAADARGGLWFQGDGTRPRIDLAAELDEAPVPVAKGFWIHHRMPAAAVEWLDAALVDGRVRNGRGLVSGDLDDWPFTQNDGCFEATGHIVGGRFKFQPDWPMLEQTDAGIAFVGNGFSVTGKGVLDGIAVEHFDAGIADFSESDLSIHANATADAARMLDLLRHSPLQKQYGEAMQGVAASGPAHGDFELLQPLHGQNAARKRLRGTVEMQGVKLSDSRWKLAFDDARGKLQYDEHGFDAERLAVKHEGQPGELSLRAGGGVRDPKQAFEAELAASFAADALLDRAPDMAWLKPWVDGRSKWSVGVSIAKGKAANADAAQLRLRSDLVGTALTLPAPLDKPAATALTTTIAMPLPLDSGEVQVAFGKRMALRARSNNGQTGVRVALGSDGVAEAAPAAGLVAGGRAGTLDALGWIAFANGEDGSDRGGKLPLRRIDVSADHLLMIGSDFPDTRVQLAPGADALAVALEGAALSGAVSVPDAKGAPIAGKLSRLHWRAPAPGVVAAAKAPAQPDDYNPAAIPPLALDIDDLRFADAKLGAAQLRTSQTATGMHIDRLGLASENQKIDVGGDWSGRGASARTQLRADVDSRNLGALLDDLGMKGRVRGGHGRMRLDASWAGSPADFSLANMQGGLDIDARDGQLLEIEPGAGRVLGLLSVAQLPRRLMLDFRDFFDKGFAFNRIEGKLAFGDGAARSDGLTIDGPAAEIRIRGSADLRAQQFDQTIDVLPKSGNLLTVVGAVAGGPIGAAVGAAANAVLKKPLGEIGAKTYRVTGPWKDPKVEVMGREQSRVEQAAAHEQGRAGAAD
ncbi:TIGR02099 family protein [Pseudoxanthomonas sangjuensis]|uniref:YhdP family protein n=1 Tax=Pseudoxanthomonas sangjuensis TaxID=1503750 RepID=UPI001390E037|nr:YhdP family protein [Pseudoxanthomonas sangjuensis]KAF1715460.1 TIGR02099 family protein [Pseudoxanthomonas sangjuensis]